MIIHDKVKIVVYMVNTLVEELKRRKIYTLLEYSLLGHDF